MTAAYGLISVIATAIIPLAYHLFGYAREDQTKWLLDQEAREYKALGDRLSSIDTELEQLGITEGHDQARTLIHIIDDYHSVIETRFAGKKYSPIAYLSAARTVQKTGIAKFGRYGRDWP